MPEQLLDDPQVGAALEQVGRERVPQPVRMPKEAAERAKTEAHVVRLKVPDDGTIGIDDLVYGHVEWPINTIEDVFADPQVVARKMRIERARARKRSGRLRSATRSAVVTARKIKASSGAARPASTFPEARPESIPSPATRSAPAETDLHQR